MRRWVVLGLLTVGIIIAYVARINFSVALATRDFRTLFHLTDSDRGMLGAAFFWSYAFLQIPAGILVDRYGVKCPYALSFFRPRVRRALSTLRPSAAGRARPPLATRSNSPKGSSAAQPEPPEPRELRLPSLRRPPTEPIFQVGRCPVRSSF